MRQVIYGQDERFIAWASERIGGIQFRPDAKTIGMERDGVIVASVIFDSFSPCDVNMHVASDGTRRWLTHEYLIHCFAFPFLQCGLRRVTGLVPAKNEDALRFDLNLGFKYEGRCENALPDDDIIVLGMTRERCRFLPRIKNV